MDVIRQSEYRIQCEFVVLLHKVMVYLCNDMCHFLTLFRGFRIDRYSILRPLPLFEPLGIELKFTTERMEALYDLTVNFDTDRLHTAKYMVFDKQSTVFIFFDIALIILMTVGDIFVTDLFECSLLRLVDVVLFKPRTSVSHELIVRVLRARVGSFCRFSQVGKLVEGCLVPLSDRYRSAWVLFGSPVLSYTERTVRIDMVYHDIRPELHFFPDLTETCFDVCFECRSCRVFRLPSHLLKCYSECRVTEREPS